MSVAQKIEELIILNLKLFKTCDRKHDMASRPADFSKKELVENMAADVKLCKQRAKIKTAIDNELAHSIIEGHIDVIDEVKNYGN